MASFYGYETHWLKPDVYYKLFIEESGVAGCRIGGQLFPGTRGNAPNDFAIPELLAQYGNDERPPVGYELLDGKNFQLPFETIKTMQFDATGALWLGGKPNSGSVRVHMDNGRIRRFIMLGNQDSTKIRKAALTLGYLVEREH